MERHSLEREPPAQALASGDKTFGYADRFDGKYDLIRTLRKGK